MLNSPRDIPCRACGAPAGASCVWYSHQAKLGQTFYGYHSTRKYTDLPLAQAAEKALLDAD